MAPVKELCYEPEGGGFETRREMKNEYQKQKNNVSGE
jgi:hypothetical protein